jgi:hypothetical protein
MEHWKKNIDSRYISGEDLQTSLKGLSPSMVVKLLSYNDADSFDQTTQKKIVVTALNFEGVYKPLVLNKTNAKQMVAITGSNDMQAWVGTTIVLYAVADKRHGFVARIKKYDLPKLQLGTTLFDTCKKLIASGRAMSELKAKYSVSPEVEQELLKP